MIFIIKVLTDTGVQKKYEQMLFNILEWAYLKLFNVSERKRFSEKDISGG